MSKPQSLCCGICEIFILSYDRDRVFHTQKTMEALESIDESELTASELSYYIGVMSRIQQMVLAAVG